MKIVLLQFVYGTLKYLLSDIKEINGMNDFTFVFSSATPIFAHPVLSDFSTRHGT